MVRASSAGVTGLRCGASESPRARRYWLLLCNLRSVVFAPTPLLIGGKTRPGVWRSMCASTSESDTESRAAVEYCRVRLLAGGAIARRGGRMGMSYLATTETVTLISDTPGILTIVPNT
jgi:hypothetical protein